jgi:hypothetical protein
LFRLAADRHLLTFTIHHACFDGWSTVVLARELKALYDAFRNGEGSSLPDPPLQYRDFVRWQQRELSGPDLARQIAYWRERLAGPPPPLQLPLDHARAETGDARGARETRRFDAELARRVEQACLREDVTPFVLCLAAFHVFLHGLTGQTDQCVGTPIVARPRAEFEGLLGFFVDTLVLRNDLTGDPTFRELLGRVRQTALGAFAHPLPFARVVQELNPKRDARRTALFDVMFSLGKATEPGLGFPIEAVEPAAAKFDWSVTLTHGPGELSAELEYRTALFDRGSAIRALAGLEAVLDATLRHPESRLSGLPSPSPRTSAAVSP